MGWIGWTIAAAGVWLVIGVANAVIVSQTPYAENPLWAKVLLWPLYWLPG
jgi:hypothetical protein